VSTGSGHGAGPDHTILGRWAETVQAGSFYEGDIHYIRATTAPYLKTVLNQLRRENWTFVVVDTLAHQTASVFEAAGRSALMIIPARNASDANEIKDRLPDEFLIRQDRLRCLVAGSEQSQSVRAAFSPLLVLTPELPFDPSFTGVIPHQNSNTDRSTSEGGRRRWCIQLADEVLKLISEPESMAS